MACCAARSASERRRAVSRACSMSVVSGCWPSWAGRSAGRGHRLCLGVARRRLQGRRRHPSCLRGGPASEGEASASGPPSAWFVDGARIAWWRARRQCGKKGESAGAAGFRATCCTGRYWALHTADAPVIAVGARRDRPLSRASIDSKWSAPPVRADEEKSLSRRVAAPRSVSSRPTATSAITAPQVGAARWLHSKWKSQSTRKLWRTALGRKRQRAGGRPVSMTALSPKRATSGHPAPAPPWITEEIRCCARGSGVAVKLHTSLSVHCQCLAGRVGRPWILLDAVSHINQQLSGKACPTKSTEIQVLRTHNPLVVGSSPTRPTNQGSAKGRIRRKRYADQLLGAFSCPHATA